METEMVTAWRVNIKFYFQIRRNVGTRLLVCSGKKSGDDKREAIAIVFLILKALWIDGK